MKMNDLQGAVRNVMIANISGNVGKSTLAKHLFQPRIPGSEIFAVETSNSTELTKHVSRGRDMHDTLIKVAEAGTGIVDVGSSNFEVVHEMLRQVPGFEEDFDLIVVPTVPARKQQADTIATVDALSTLGVPAKKIRVLFNMLDPGEQVDTVFSGIFDYHRVEQRFLLCPDAAVRSNQLLARLEKSSLSVAAILNDPTDATQMLTQATNQEERLRYAQMRIAKRAAAGLAQELDRAFMALTVDRQ